VRDQVLHAHKISGKFKSLLIQDVEFVKINGCEPSKRHHLTELDNETQNYTNEPDQRTRVFIVMTIRFIDKKIEGRRFGGFLCVRLHVENGTYSGENLYKGSPHNEGLKQLRRWLHVQQNRVSVHVNNKKLPQYKCSKNIHNICGFLGGSCRPLQL
jgi:hypothetical protein